MLLKLSKKESLSEEESQEITKLHDEILTLSEQRNLKNSLDIDFLKKEISKL